MTSGIFFAEVQHLTSVLRSMNKTRYEIRDTGSDYTLTVADPDGDLPEEVLGWLAAGEAELVAIEPDGKERIVCGKDT